MPYRIKSPVTHSQIGRRGACLIVFGFIPFSTGFALFLQPTSQSGARRTIPALDSIARPEVWAALWMVFGVFVMACAFLDWRWLQRGFVDLISWILGELITGWIAAMVNMGYSLLVVVISGWDEPSVMALAIPEEEVERE
jgi:hypothetical protein